MDYLDWSKAYVVILEQPASKSTRFRYESECRTAGTIPGASSSDKNKTYPTIRVHGYNGRALVKVMCVSYKPPFELHPHKIVGKENCSEGVCTVLFQNQDMKCEFPYLGIQCVKRSEIQQRLNDQENRKPAGVWERNPFEKVNLNVIRLCFQVFLELPAPGRFEVSLTPVVSDPIYDTKSITDLRILKLSHDTSPANGDKEIIILCEKVSKADVVVRFFEDYGKGIIWEDYATFLEPNVHKQYAITCLTPPYLDKEIDSVRNVYIQLKSPTNASYSKPWPFQYTPVHPELKRKKVKMQIQMTTVKHTFQQHTIHQTLQTRTLTLPVLDDIQPTRKPDLRFPFHTPTMDPGYNISSYNACQGQDKGQWCHQALSHPQSKQICYTTPGNALQDHTKDDGFTPGALVPVGGPPEGVNSSNYPCVSQRMRSGSVVPAPSAWLQPNVIQSHKGVLQQYHQQLLQLQREHQPEIRRQQERRLEKENKSQSLQMKKDNLWQQTLNKEEYVLYTSSSGRQVRVKNPQFQEHNHQPSPLA